MRNPLIAGNWKMNMTIAEGVALVDTLKNALAGMQGAEAAVCPPFTLLKPIADALAGGNIALGAQDMFWEAKGAYTGQISGAMLIDVCCTYVIIGHSERRGRFGAIPAGWSDELLQAFGDNDMVVNRKVHAAFGYGLIPIMCCGETLDERERGITDEVVASQIRLGLRNLTTEQVAGMVIAYEPVWAIGTGPRVRPAGRQPRHRPHPRRGARDVRQRRRQHPHPVRRQRHPGEYRRDYGAAGNRRRPGRRRLAETRLCRDGESRRRGEEITAAPSAKVTIR